MSKVLQASLFRELPFLSVFQISHHFSIVVFPFSMLHKEPEMPIGNFLEMYPELCLRGLKEMVPLGFLKWLVTGATGNSSWVPRLLKDEFEVLAWKLANTLPEAWAGMLPWRLDERHDNWWRHLFFFTNLFYPFAILPFASDDLVGFELIYCLPRGYYTNSLDARPLVGPHGASNAYVCGGMGTYGLMGSPAAGHHWA